MSKRIQLNTIDLGGGTTKGCDCEAPDLKAYAKKEDVPKKVSELENDSGFVKEVDYLYLPDIGITESFSLDLNIENITKEQSDAIIKAGRFQFAPPTTKLNLSKNPIFTLKWQDTYATFGFYYGVPNLEARTIRIIQETYNDIDNIIFDDALIGISTTSTAGGNSKENAVIEKLEVSYVGSDLFRMHLESSKEQGAINWEISGNTDVGGKNILKAKVHGLGTAAYANVEDLASSNVPKLKDTVSANYSDFGDAIYNGEVSKFLAKIESYGQGIEIYLQNAVTGEYVNVTTLAGSSTEKTIFYLELEILMPGMGRLKVLDNNYFDNATIPWSKDLMLIEIRNGNNVKISRYY